MNRYYSAGGARVAMRIGSNAPYSMLTDHLGSTSIMVTSAGVEYGEVRYMPWGSDRYTYGTSAEYCRATTVRYTGQRQEASIGLYFYGAKWYDPALGRFISPDSIIPAQQGVMGNDRYAYSSGNPVKYIDPTGHYACDPKQCGYTHDNDEGWSPVKELQKLRNENGEFAEVIDIEYWDSNYKPEYDPYLEDARNGDIPGVWSSDVMAIEQRNGFENDLGGSARAILLNLLGGVGEYAVSNLSQITSATSLMKVRFDPNQNALIQLSKEAKNKGVVTQSEAYTLREWAEEYKLYSHGPEQHFT